jgi:hypothetical protein
MKFITVLTFFKPWPFMITHDMFGPFVTGGIKMTSCDWWICFSLSLSCQCKDQSQLNHTLTFIKWRLLLSCATDWGCTLIKVFYNLKKCLYSILMHDITLYLLKMESMQHYNKTAVFDCFPLSIHTLWNKCQWSLCFLRLFYIFITRILQVLATE